jgi:dTDP-4-amino-4,6-dideoxygalactose transaminase
MTGSVSLGRSARTSFLPFALPTIGEEEIAEVVSVLRSGWVTTGPRTRAFEEQFRAAVDAPAALAVSSGTAAMHLALVAMGVGPGHRVFTTPLTFCSTVHVIEHVGARPVLVDVEPDTLNIDPARLVAAVEEDADEAPAAVIPVHYAGHPCDMAAITEVAHGAGLRVVEDAAHAFGACYRGQPVGHIDERLDGHAVCFSLYATKNITTGEGGVLTASPAVVERARPWSLHGMSRDAWRRYDSRGSWEYEVVHPGFKYNFTDLQAALGCAQLRRRAELERRRTAIARQYTEAFAGMSELQTPAERPDIGHAWHLYPVRIDPARLAVSRGQFVAELTARNIGSSVHFIPVHEHAYYRQKYGWRPDDFPVAHREFTRMLSLPIYPRMTDEDVQDVITAVQDVIVANRRRA